MKIFILTSLFLILASCSPGNQTDVLDDVGFFISEDPERALSVLDSMSSSGELRGRETKARFALLYSMALDKNYIDSIDTIRAAYTRMPATRSLPWKVS